MAFELKRLTPSPCLFEPIGTPVLIWIETRLHPQGKGGPQAILCGQRLKTWTKNENTTTIRIQKSSVFERSAIYQSWTFWLKKCVFDRSRVADRRYVFAKLTDPLISTDRGCLDCATQKSCPGHFYTVTKLPKICLFAAAWRTDTHF